MDILKGIKFSPLIFIIISILFIACGYNQKINDITGVEITSKIKLKKTDSYSNCFCSEVVQVYDIIDTTILSTKFGKNFICYDTNNVSYFQSSKNLIYKYIQNSYGFYSKKQITTHRFAAIYIDTKNCQLIYQEVSYTMD